MHNRDMWAVEEHDWGSISRVLRVCRAGHTGNGRAEQDKGLQGMGDARGGTGRCTRPCGAILSLCKEGRAEDWMGLWSAPLTGRMKAWVELENVRFLRRVAEAEALAVAVAE